MDTMKAALLTLARALTACTSNGAHADGVLHDCQPTSYPEITYRSAYASCMEAAAEGRRLARTIYPTGVDENLDLTYGTACLALTGEITYSDPNTYRLAVLLADKVCPGDVENMRPA